MTNNKMYENWLLFLKFMMMIFIVMIVIIDDDSYYDDSTITSMNDMIVFSKYKKPSNGRIN